RHPGGASVGGDRQGQDHRRRRAPLLRREQGLLRRGAGAGQPRRPQGDQERPRGRQEGGAGEAASNPRQRRGRQNRLRGGGEALFAGPDGEGRRRPRNVPPQDGHGREHRQGGLLTAGQRDQRGGGDRVRPAPHQGDRAQARREAVGVREDQGRRARPV